MPKKTDSMDAVLANIEKQMGNKGSSVITRFSKIKTQSVPVISFGIPAIDEASHCGGLPRGKMVELFGHESSGKSLLSLYIIAQAQKQGLECVLLDIEQSFDPVWAAKHGVDVENLIYANTFDKGGEQALEYAYQLCKSGKFALVVIDSTAALTPLAELEGTLQDNARVGAQAQLMSRGCRKIRSVCGQNNTTCVFINQIRDKIGVMYGNPETTPGGKALKFYSDVRMRTQNKGKITVKTSDSSGKPLVVGQNSEVVFVKNKIAQPFGRASFKIIFDDAALNPVVMLCNEARSFKLIRPYKGIYRVSKEITGKMIDTGVTDVKDLADYLIENKLVIPIIDKMIEMADEDPTIDSIDDAILEMKENPSKIVSPNEVKVDANKLEDAKEEDLDEDIEEETPEDIEE